MELNKTLKLKEFRDATGKTIYVVVDAAGRRIGNTKWGRTVARTIKDLFDKSPAGVLSKIDDIPWGKYCENGCEDVASKIHDAIGGKVLTIWPKDRRLKRYSY